MQNKTTHKYMKNIIHRSALGRVIQKSKTKKRGMNGMN